MVIFDKAQWHIDAGENVQDAVSRIRTVFQFLKEHAMLNGEGLELWELGIDSSASLHERMVTKEGFDFLSRYYDELIQYPPSRLMSALEEKV